MESAEVLDLGTQAIWVLIKVSTPLMLVALIVGLIIALFQALTQIQEMTLTFVPKILAIFFTIVLLMPFIITALQDFSNDLFDRIVAIE